MKRNIEIININPSLLSWIKNNLKNTKDNIPQPKEIINGFNDLENGNCQSLIIQLDNGENNNNYSDKIVCDDLVIHYSTRSVMRNNEEIFLTPKEFDILYFLARNKGEVFTKEQIYQAVWEDDYLLDDSNIMAFIRKIRKKIEPNPDSPKYILTIWGIGYKFNDKI